MPARSTLRMPNIQVDMPQEFYYRIILITLFLSSCNTMFADREPATPTSLRIPVTAIVLPAYSNCFDPRYDDFSFRNYGFDTRFLNMIPVDVARLFGSNVCVGKQTPLCILIPSPHVWMQETNRAVQTGIAKVWRF